MTDLRDAATEIRDTLFDGGFTKDTGRRCADAIEAVADAMDALEGRVACLERERAAKPEQEGAQ